MKKRILLIILIGMSFSINAQNTFPTTGNVGIGTILPKAKLELFKENTGLRNSVQDLLSLNSTHSSIGYDGFGTAIVDFRRTYQNSTPHAINRISFIERGNSISNKGGAILFSTKELSSGSLSPIERMRIDYNGNIGIGTTSPNSQFHLASDSNHAFSMSRKNGTYGFKILRNAQEGNVYFQIATGSNQWETKIKIGEGEGINTKLLFNPDGGNVGIGTNNPDAKLSVNGEVKVHNENSTTAFGNIQIKHQSTGTSSIADVLFIDKDNSATRATLQIQGNGGTIETAFFASNGNVGIGTTSPDAKLAVNGKIHTKEVKVDLLGWSDFVFYKNYKLPTLLEVEKHIKEKGHLKDIPSAKEVEKNGIFLGEMDSKLLQKIEELTLYTIQQEKKIKKLESMNSKLLELQKRLEKLEKE